MRREREKDAESTKKQKKSIWEDVIADVSGGSEATESCLLLLGKKGTGKRTLLNTLYKEYGKQEVTRKAKKLVSEHRIGSSYSVVDYGFLHLKDRSDESDEILSTMHCWILDDPAHKEYLKKMMKPYLLRKCVAAIVVDCEEPWDIPKSIQQWIEVLMDLLEEHMKGLDLEIQETMHKSIEMYIKKYVEPKAEESKDKPELEVEDPDAKLKEELPLGEGVLTVNLGIPLLILCTKSETILSNEKGLFSEQTFDLMLKEIREGALSYGASTIFVSSTAQINLELLYTYLAHRLFAYDFKFKAITDEKERIFIPSGFDSSLLITEMAKNAGETPFEAVFKKPEAESNNTKEEIKCDDFSLILAQWKASSSRKGITGATAGLSKPFSSNFSRDSKFLKPSNVKPATEENKDHHISGDDKAKMVTEFWTKMKANPPKDAFKYSLAAKKSTATGAAPEPMPFQKAQDAPPSKSE